MDTQDRGSLIYGYAQYTEKGGTTTVVEMDAKDLFEAEMELPYDAVMFFRHPDGVPWHRVWRTTEGILDD